MRIKVTQDGITLICESEESDYVDQWFRSYKESDSVYKLPLEVDSPDFAILEEFVDCYDFGDIYVNGQKVTSSKQLRGILNRFV